ncbi:MAG: aspartate aminotransferase family protein, partial [Saprospiraceae bacterium]
MKPFDVYTQWNIHPVRSEGAFVWDDKGKRYLDFYSGHGVISIGHSHPIWAERLKRQIDTLAFYSNAVLNNLQGELAEKMGQLSGYPSYQLFVVNSGAEAIENALKVASFFNKKKKVLSFNNAFHGRTTGALAVTDNLKIQPAFNKGLDTVFLPLNDETALEEALQNKDVTAVLIEGIQGIGGVIEPTAQFLQAAERLCQKYDAMLVLDEIQSGYGRTGKFFAHQHAGIRPGIITTAKGMGNGFPAGGVLIHEKIAPYKGMLGSTFGGTHLACAASIGVLDVIREEGLMENAAAMGRLLIQSLTGISEIKQIRGKGLMIGLDMGFPVKPLQKALLKAGIFTGNSKDPHVLRLLPPLCITQQDVALFVETLHAG